MSDLPPMGAVVTVTCEYYRERKGKTRAWCSRPVTRRAGWVVGHRTIQDVIVVDSYGPVDSVAGTHPAILVAYGPRTLPVRVPPDGVELGGTPDPGANWRWSAHDLEAMREEVRSWPRDARGRWTREGADDGV